jgi:hypothetical protein
MNSTIIPFDYDGNEISFNTDGWINATEIARPFGKRPVDWLKQDETRQYLKVLGEVLNCDPESLLETRRGRHHGGTWLHPKLGVRFAQWLDVRFAVWCDLQIDSILHGDLGARQQLENACKALEYRKDLASQQGKGLSAWRWQKPTLENRVEYWREQLQLTLALDGA